MAGQSSVGAEAAASSAARLSELMASLDAHVSRLHPVPPREQSVVALDLEGAGQVLDGESTATDSDDRRAGGERRGRRSGGLRPVS